MNKFNQHYTPDNIDFAFLNNYITRLAEILHIENQLLLEFKITEANKMQEEKNKIMSYIEVTKNFIKNNKKFVRNNDSNLINMLKTNLEFLDNLIIKNSYLISKAMLVNQKITEIVTTQIFQENSYKSGYNQEGGFSRKNKNYTIQPITLTNLV